DASTADMPADAHGYAKMAKFFGAQIEDCTRRTLERWRGRLPGVEVTTPSHCEALLASRRVD
ncbi:MAG TPA: hypothetical protein VMN37_04670, partial [Gemmatimonadales bacterium]|nr:hypothetical protein [Gemmatimonadales bacterium]